MVILTRIQKCCNYSSKNSINCNINISLYAFSNFISCTVWTNQDPCQSRPCQNGGECLQVGDSYKCMCTSNFEGKNCEQKKSELASGYK